MEMNVLNHVFWYRYDTTDLQRVDIPHWALPGGPRSPGRCWWEVVAFAPLLKPIIIDTFYYFPPPLEKNVAGEIKE